MARRSSRVLGFALLASAAAAVALPTAATVPVRETVRTLLQHELPNAPGRTFTSVVVEFPPGARSLPHRHGQAFVYAYVLRGEIRSKVDDEPERVYRIGDGWYELPGAHHRVAENASATEPAALLAVLISNTGDALQVEDAAPK